MQPKTEHDGMKLTDYIGKIAEQHGSGNATEHTYRPTLQNYLEAALGEADLVITNEPKHIDCGAPDYLLTRKKIPFGYIEAKDLGKNLDDATYKDQFERYKSALNNLIFTDYLEFRLFRDGKQVAVVKIAELIGRRVESKPQNFAALGDLLTAFADYRGQTITSPDDLAERMAMKARLLANIIDQALTQDTPPSDKIEEKDQELKNQFQIFKKHLVHDISPHQFADMYAQTIAYGMFSARLHDSTLPTFSRKEAAERIPVNNPFLRKFFQHIAGYDFDSRLQWVVDDLADIFRAADVAELMKDYGKTTQQTDPFLHFYETFLGAYNPALRKSRGVYYTPEPVVDFIVRAVHEILRNEFGLAAGLADCSTTTLSIGDSTQELHRVQILDPATGTGTFLAHIVRHIHRQFASQKGMWDDYVKNQLIPRLNGFEILMASYAVAHTKMQMEFQNTACKLGDERLRIFLTNSLEEHHTDQGGLFAQWLSDESREANFIKRDMPVMVVIGNPPYSGESANKSEWISKLMRDYKQEPGGGKLQEKNSKWLNDDYAKFIRCGQHFVDKTGEGILAYITNHSFLDNPTFRGMRWSLLRSFDAIYILDLHGNSKKKETAPDGSADKNVFDIQQGVAISLFVKTGAKKVDELAKVFHHDLFGTRESKYQFLWDNDLLDVEFQPLQLHAPNYFFVQKDYELLAEYEQGFSVNDLFEIRGSGIVTKRDNLAIHHKTENALQAAKDILNMDKDAFYHKYSLPIDVRDWRYEWAKDDIAKFGISDKLVQKITYRLFDTRRIVYTGCTRGFIGWPVTKVMRHFLAGENVGFVTIRRSRSSQSWKEVFVTDSLINGGTTISALDNNYVFPLYCYPETKQKTVHGKTTREPNLDKEIVQQIAAGLGLSFTPEKESANKTTFAPIDLLDYIYAVLHAPAYREKYKEFLKIDFPRVPYPTDANQFYRLGKLGAELRALHLMQSPTLDTLITAYPASGDHMVTKPQYKSTDPVAKLGKVRINQAQFFDGVPEIAWNFYIGGYQPAQKWLKDRKGRTLTTTEIVHYQKIIIALTETHRLMGEVDKVLAGVN